MIHYKIATDCADPSNPKKNNKKTHTISDRLPREIALRKKQFEYHRELLLSFPKPDAEVAA